MKRKLLSILVCITTLSLCLMGCTGNTTKKNKNGKLKELNTTFSEYDSQPDLMDQVSDESDVIVYSNIINGKGYYN